MKGPLVGALLAIVLAATPSPPVATPEPSPSSDDPLIRTDADGDAVTATTEERSRRAARAAGASRSSTSTGPVLTDFMRAGHCGVTEGVVLMPTAGQCPTDVTDPPECEPGTRPLEPLWRRERDTESSPWGPWELVTGWTCSTDGMPTELTQTDFRRLPLAPPGIRVQPDTPEVLVNMPTITIAQAPDQTLTTTLLGTPVEVRATATTYTWDYGDGTDPLTTTSPGHPWPDHDVHHTYTAPGTYTITLTATWTGQWRITGTTTWLPVQGTATTTATHTPITAVEARTHLVADDCHTNPTAPTC